MATIQQLQSIDTYEFEKLVAELWETKGYDTNVRNKSNDKKIDIDAERGGISEKIRVKRYDQNNKMGSEEVRKYATIYQQTDANNITIVTSGEFTDPARELATDLNMDLCSGKELLQQLESSSVDISDYIDSSQSGQSSTAGAKTSSSRDIEASSAGRSVSSKNESSNSDRILAKTIIHIIGLIALFMITLTILSLIGPLLGTPAAIMIFPLWLASAGVLTILSVIIDDKSSRLGTFLLGLIYFGLAMLWTLGTMVAL
jgi:hypothetical protein